MNFTGGLFGGALVLCLGGALAAAVLKNTRAAIVALSGSMLGVAGIALALGNDFIAVLVAGLLGIAVPAVALVALRVAPAPPRDVQMDGRWSRPLLLLILFLILAWALLAAPWIPPGGTRQSGIEWLGSRLLTDHIILLLLLPALLAVAATSIVALLRGRSTPRS